MKRQKAIYWRICCLLDYMKEDNHTDEMMEDRYAIQKEID